MYQYPVTLAGLRAAGHHRSCAAFCEFLVAFGGVLAAGLSNFTNSCGIRIRGGAPHLAHIMGTRVQRLFLLSVVALSTSTGQRGTLPLFLQDGSGYSVGVPPRYHHGEETSALPCCTF